MSRRNRRTPRLTLFLFVALGACGAPEPIDPAPDAAIDPETSALSPDLQHAVEISRAHLGAHGLGKSQLALATVFEDDLRLVHARFRQLHDGVPVFGGEGIVHLARGQVTAVTDAFVPGVAVDPTPVLSADDARTGAVAAIGCTRCAAAPPATDLWILRHAGRDHLVWRVQLRLLDGTTAPSMPVVFIDAHDGTVVWRYDNLQTGSGPSLYSGTITVDTLAWNGQFYLEDVVRKLGTFDRTVSPPRFVDADDLWDAPLQRAGLDAHLGAKQTYEYLKNVHGRTGINGTGGPTAMTAIDGTPVIASHVHYGTNYNNAFWDGSQMTYGDGDNVTFSPLVTLDVAGHEMMHGVTQFTAGLIYANESGALNESYSDVFGAMVELYTRGDSEAVWKIGDECYTPAVAGDALRHMDAPHLANEHGYTADDDPDHYSERYTGGGDNGGVHINSGISNKTFYLLAKGGAHHLGGSMTGIGPAQAAAIWYRALTVYMTSSTNFAQGARATYLAAIDLHGAGSVEAQAVVTAWGLCGIVIDTQPPTTAITSPADGATVIGTTTITAGATDNTAVTRVEFYVDNVLRGTDTSAPYGYVWNTAAASAGSHTLHGKAFDAANNVAQSATITVTVAHETNPPTTAITAPAHGATVSGTVTIAATASDDTAVARVELRVDGALIVSDTTAPYSAAWNSNLVANGSHTVTSTAVDTFGNSATSPAITITTANDKTPPAVAITAPADGATVAGATAITATATDASAITRVDFYVDNLLKGTDTTAPYAYAWDTVAAGNGAHTLLAKAVDAFSNTGTSAPVAVTVTNLGLATYDPVRRAPTCTTVHAFCDTGALIDGRDGKGPEANASNTINASCADGTGGSYHADESLDRLRIATTDGTPLAAGKTVTIEATVWNFGSDTLDLYFTTTPSAPNWTLITSVPGGAANGAQTLSATFTLPSTPLMAIRGNFRYGGSAAPCTSGSYDDRDDLVFALAVTPDTTAPTTAITAPAPRALLRGAVTVTATATDDVGVTAVVLHVDGVTVATDTAPPYSLIWNSAPSADGDHTLRTRATDAAGNVADSAPVTVTTDNAAPVTIISFPTADAVLGGTIDVFPAASDLQGVTLVEVFLDGVLLGADATVPYVVAWNTITAADGVHTLTSRAHDAAGNTATSPPVTVTVANGIRQAAYDPALRAPRCSAFGSGCDTVGLVNGRDGRGPESNAPNTLHNACGDGTSGTYHVDESIDRLRVYTTDGRPMAPGRTVTIEATIWNRSNLLESDALDLYYATNPSAPTWLYLTTLVPGNSTGVRVLFASLTLPSSATVAIRSNLRRRLLGGGSPSTCTAGGYNDHDDLVLTLAP